MAVGVACFNTQPPEGGWRSQCSCYYLDKVSTHSRPKAAGASAALLHAPNACFNTQPPEGGWAPPTSSPLTAYAQFQHTAARRRLGLRMLGACSTGIVSTHSRPKAAGSLSGVDFSFRYVSTHSRPKAAGCCKPDNELKPFVSTHSRPKAAGIHKWMMTACILSFNTQPPEGGWQLQWQYIC